MNVNILAVGDVCGETGLGFAIKTLPGFKKMKNISFCVVNAENTVQSLSGTIPHHCEELLQAGADVLTLGNHTWDRRELWNFLDDCPYILRPSNYAPQTPGRGWGIFDSPFGDVCVMNLIGRCEMSFGTENPFFEADKILRGCDCKIKLVDFHAEATSEKLSMAFHIDGRASALWGTHTHVQTADAEVFPAGLGYITDLGMTGARRGIIGITPSVALSRFLGDPPERIEDAGGAAKLEGAIFEIDPKTGKCVGVEPVRLT
ncbi:MAG: YmdB family metallophosphoesterase [Oscillospiraceae bacterium]|jgi:metallophosphoesterase (TIGR00282 family)|nr:YmdB family metallophosphoesterase [Oscillospiraceae bacterium]